MIHLSFPPLGKFPLDGFIDYATYFCTIAGTILTHEASHVA